MKQDSFIQILFPGCNELYQEENAGKKIEVHYESSIMKKIFIPFIWIILLSCSNNAGKSDKGTDTANIHTLDTTKQDSSGMKIDNTENKQNEDSLPPIQH